MTTDIQPAMNADAARWLLDADVDWGDLVQFGPPGFAVYVRIAFPEEGVEHPTVREALATLASHTTTADRGYAAVWEGWGGGPPMPQAPPVPIPNREMLLFTGPVEALRDAPAVAWGDEPGCYDPPPHLAWPADQAWCVACDVDEELEFSVGCSEQAAAALAIAFPGAVRRVEYGEDIPMYHDD